VSDGTRLAMHVLRPALNGTLLDTLQPVVLANTPYRARTRRANAQIFGPSVTGAADAALLAAGYALAIADVRGKGASFGARRGFQDRTEAIDGYDLVQWLAGQPWSNRKVGMYGCSYLGGSALHVATTAPPALRAIFAGATDLDALSPRAANASRRIWADAGEVSWAFAMYRPPAIRSGVHPTCSRRRGSTIGDEGLNRSAVTAPTITSPMRRLSPLVVLRDRVARPVFAPTAALDFGGGITRINSVKA
jgi:predicted acyl esterase